MTTTAMATTRGRFGWPPTMLLTVAIALLGLMLLPRAAGAMDSSKVHSNAMFQIALCEAGGGKAQVDVTRTVEGIKSIQVTCTGGVYGGMWCDNSQSGVVCTGAHPHPASFEPGSQPSRTHLWQLGEVIPILESGSLTQVERLVADIEAYELQADAGPNMARGELRETAPEGKSGKDQHGKQGKFGKHGGKHRR